MDEDDLMFHHEDYPSYEEREEIKQRAWKGFYNGDDRQKVHCLLHGIIWAHYWRAREDLEENKKIYRKVMNEMYREYIEGYQLDIDRYTNHWLYSMKEKVSESVLKILKEEWHYEPQEFKYLPKGATIYV